MSVGDLIQIGEISFYETLHGPMVPGICHDCGTFVLVAGRGASYTFSKEPRCGGCWRKHHGIDHEA